MSSHGYPPSPQVGQTASSSYPTSPSANNGSGPPADPAVAYSPRPPAWRPLLHPGSEEVSYPDFYPSKTGKSSDRDPERGSLQPEDDMSEAHVRQGMTAKQAVMNESFSAHGLILSILPQLVSTLNSLFQEALERRSGLSIGSSTSHVRPHTNKLPPRVTLNDVKLSAYVRDLADPAVPLSRLAKSIPHGFRGERMLEMLWQGTNPTVTASLPASGAVKMSHTLSSSSNTGASGSGASPSSTSSSPGVEISRALWFIRTVGASDLAMRSRSATAVSAKTYTADFTSTCTAWLRKQLGDIPISSTESTIGSSSDVQKWAAKWRYSLLLMDALQSQSLLDKRTWAVFVVNLLKEATLTQMPFVLALTQDALEDILANDQLTKRVALAALEIRSRIQDRLPETSDEFAAGLLHQLRSIVQAIWSESPVSLVSPRLWQGVYAKDIVHTIKAMSSTSEELTREIDLIKSRSSALLTFRHGSSRVPPLRSDDLCRTIIALLDEFALQRTDDVVSMLASRGPSPACSLLAQWAATAHRPSHQLWRPLLAARVMQQLGGTKKMWMGKGSRSSTSSAASRSSWLSVDLNHVLSQWLESLETAQDTVDFDRLVLLFAELTRNGTFSYTRFLHRLTARGWTYVEGDSRNPTSSSSVGTNSVQFRLLRSLPIPQDATNPALLHQRRLALYGSRSKETREEAAYRRGLRELKEAASFLTIPDEASHNRTVWEGAFMAIPHLRSGSLYVKRQLVAGHLLPSAIQWVRGNTGGAYTVERFAEVVLIMEAAADWKAIAEMMRWQLARIVDTADDITTKDALSLVSDIFVVHRDKWVALDIFTTLQPIFKSLCLKVLAEDDAKIAASLFAAGELGAFDALISVTEQKALAPLTPTQSSGRIFSNGGRVVDDLDPVLADLVHSGMIDSSAPFLPGRQAGISIDWLDSDKSKNIITLCHTGALSLAKILTSLLLPMLHAAAFRSQEPNVNTLLPMLQLWRALALDAADAPRQDLRRRALVAKVPSQDLLQFAAVLASLMTVPTVTAEISKIGRAVVRDILGLPHVSDAVTARPRVMSDAARIGLRCTWADPWAVLCLLYGSLDYAGLLIARLDSPLDLDVSQLLPLIDPWRQAALIEELAFIFEQLAVVEGGQQGRADAKVTKCSQVLFSRLFLQEDDDGSRLWAIGGKAYRTATVETAWRVLLSAEEAGDASQASAVLQAIFRLASQCEGQRLPPTQSDSTSKLFVLLRSRLITVAPSGYASLAHEVSVLQALLLSSSFWTIPTVRQGVGEVLASLFSMLSVPPQDDGDVRTATMLYDVVAYVMEELPDDLLPICTQAFQPYIGTGEWAFGYDSDSRQQARMLLKLSPFSPLSRNAASDYVLAAPSQVNLPAPDNSWGWADPLDAGTSHANSGLQSRSASSTTSTAAGVAPPQLHTMSPLTLLPLDNTASISLQHFAPRRSISVPICPDQDYQAVQNIREGYPRTSAGDDDAEGWRSMLSERHHTFLADDVREGKYLLPAAAFRAKYPLDTDGVEEVGAETESHRQSATSGSYQSFAQLVGLPDGPVRTMEDYLRRDREKRARENKEKRDLKAANQRVTRFVKDQHQQRNGSGQGAEREGVDSAEASAAHETLPHGPATGDTNGNGSVAGTSASRKRKVSMDASIAGSEATDAAVDPSGDGKNRPKGRKRTA
ncbi:hypothetical protein BCV69DRAFT_315015 [Microstroma glucosiphilum]|uniref:Mediator of RNA polymerase II transcription subunit 12 n=1 Tax=Pseudomicrostroma glucosiphilum TaxID=1684307 RepID=A0A316TXU3_9BASI|nr:hypothetical protein BCV69DRAFT_315015 [Pseudomicrostroma glucosiphilum]PWN18179.1 hypothetical protein BCV69DRAFT_315015 [Pseudomicrostroma glucosiphilum]